MTISDDNISKQDTVHTNDTGFGHSESSTGSSQDSRSLESLPQDDLDNNELSDNDASGFSDEDSSLFLSDDDLSSEEDEKAIDNGYEESFDNLRFSALNKSNRSYNSNHSSSISNSNDLSQMAHLSGTMRSVQSAALNLPSYVQRNDSFKKKLAVDKTAIHESDQVTSNNLKKQMQVLESNSGQHATASTSILQSIGNFFKRSINISILLM